jgi:hypothetical protein
MRKRRAAAVLWVVTGWLIGTSITRGCRVKQVTDPGSRPVDAPTSHGRCHRDAPDPAGREPVQGSTWLLTGAVVLLTTAAIGLLATVADRVTGHDVSTLVIAALGVLGTHLGHVTGHAQGMREARSRGRVPQ